MKKFLAFFDNYLLKIAVSFLIVFIAWYPKLPSINIHHTWVYIRLEDFSIAITFAIWLILLLRRKVRIPFATGAPIALYWIFGFLSLVFSLLIIAPTLANFFPSVAILSYARRIEYMILFFISFSTIKSIKDLRDYVVILSVTAFGFILYAFGQRYYLDLWNAFPTYFNKYQFCFPSFQTGNEEFAKGIPLCLPKEARITSTFAGHYDLGAYLVLIIPIFSALSVLLRKSLYKVLMGTLAVLSMTIAILTASRISFIAYIIATIIAFISIKQKKLIIPFIILSFVLLMVFSESTARRFMQTFRLTSVVTNSQGQIVGQALSEELKARLAKDKGILANIPDQSLPEGSGFIGLPQIRKQTTNVGVVQSSLSLDEAKRLQLENGGIEIATISGTFLVQQAFVYDISFTTRFQAEWPNALKAFEKNPVLGSGFATITLASDNDFLRFLGESGILGLASFLFIFLIFKITFKASSKDINNPLALAFIYGFAAGVIGLFINATLIDVFESSKVAETLWILSGIAIGTALLYKKDEINYKGELKRILTSRVFLWIYASFAFFLIFIPTIGNFFVADDFTWLKWAANTTLFDLGRNFIDAQGFFYRPLDKNLIFFLYSIFAFKPEAYHIFILVLHLLVGLGVYFLGLKLFKKFAPAFVAALIFLFLPSQAENIFWFSTISTTLCTFFIVYGLLAFVRFREGKILSYSLSIILNILGLLSYEMGVIFFPLVLAIDFIWRREKLNSKTVIPYIPFILTGIGYWYLRNYANVVAAGGDYAYSISHLIPNFIGNLMGYFGVFTFGEKFFVIYDAGRAALRTHSSVVLIAGVIMLTLIALVTIVYRERLKKSIQTPSIKIIFFGFIFSVISLLPFLGLGNISERYGYLASIGFTMILTVAIFALRDSLLKFVRNNKIYSNIILFVILIFLGIFYVKEIYGASSEWGAAGKITQRTLSLFRIYYPTLTDYSTIYIVNVPIKDGSVWTFPTGIDDGLWFVYRFDHLNIKYFSNLSDARRTKSNLSEGEKQNTYIFYFDKDKKIQNAE